MGSSLDIFIIHIILRLGDMYFMMSFIGCVGNLMARSKLDKILTAAFGGVENMLNGKNCPQNFCALRMVDEELLCNVT